MLFFISNITLYLYTHLYENILKMKLLRLITNNVKTASVMSRKFHPGVLLDITTNQDVAPIQELVPPECTTQLWADDSLEITAVKPQLCVDLSTWTSYLGTQNYKNSSLTDGNCHILLEISQPADPQAFLDQSMSVSPARRIRVRDLTYPIAWKSGIPFSIVSECSPKSLVELVIGLKEGRLMLDDMLELNCITTISLIGSAVNLLRPSSPSLETNGSSLLAPPSDYLKLHRESSWANVLDSLHSQLEEPVLARVGKVSQSQVLSEVESNESLASLMLPDQFVAGLVAQHDQVTRLKTHYYQSDSESSSLVGDSGGGEAPSESLEILAPEVLTPAHRRSQNRNKPPNVLIYCGKKDSARQYEAVKNVFGQCLNPDRYTIYHLKHEQVLDTPWKDSSVLLIIASEKVYDGIDQAFLDYFAQGGTVLSLASAYDALFLERIQISKNIGVLSLCFRQWRDVTAIRGRYVYKDCTCLLPDINVVLLAKDAQIDRPVMVEASHELSGGVALLTQINLDKDPIEMAITPDIFSSLKKHNPARFEILRDLLTQLGLDCDGGEAPAITACYLMAIHEKSKSSLIASLEPRLQQRLLKARDLSLLFCEHSDPTIATSEVLPVYTDVIVPADRFNMETYKRRLSTAILGHVVFYAEVVNTTMNFFDGMMFSVPEDVGVICIASRQASGQGRGGNTWLSPHGCAMFSLHVRIPVDSELGQRVAFLQHIVSLAVVQAVTKTPGYQKIDLRLKWPNDIYYGSTMKLGGVIVKSSIMVDTIHANIGCGFNVANPDPTICINDLVEQHNQSNGTSLHPFTVEELIARTVSCVETLIELFQQEGKQAFVECYYEKWLHSNSQVHLQAEKKDVIVIGVDDYGFLSVKSPDGAVSSVHPDGNSFDMMRNLIVPKTR